MAGRMMKTMKLPLDNLAARLGGLLLRHLGRDDFRFPPNENRTNN